MAWTAYVNADAPAPSWVVHPARITSLHPRLTALPPVMMQALGKQKDVTVDSITATVDDRIVAKWKRRGVCPLSAGGRFSDPSYQNWTELEQPVTPQQNNFKNAYATRLACGIYAILSSMYAMREWSIDFVEQSHNNNARNWMVPFTSLCFLFNQCFHPHDLGEFFSSFPSLSFIFFTRTVSCVYLGEYLFVRVCVCVCACLCTLVCMTVNNLISPKSNIVVCSICSHPGGFMGSKRV